jgi:hypothetical protein
VKRARPVLQAQLVAGLEGLGLLRSYPFLDADEAAARLDRIRESAPEANRRLEGLPFALLWELELPPAARRRRS